MIQAADTSIALTVNETRVVLSVLGVCMAAFLRIAWSKAKSFAEVAERTRAIDQTLHGDPKAHEPNGLVRKLSHVATKVDGLSNHFERHVTEEATQMLERNRLLNEANNKLHTRLLGIEDRLPGKRKPRSA